MHPELCPLAVHNADAGMYSAFLWTSMAIRDFLADILSPSNSRGDGIYPSGSVSPMEEVHLGHRRHRDRAVPHITKGFQKF